MIGRGIRKKDYALDSPADHSLAFGNRFLTQRRKARALIKRRGREGFRKGRKENLPPRSSAPTSASSALKILAQFETTDGHRCTRIKTSDSSASVSAYSCHQFSCQFSCRISAFCFPNFYFVLGKTALFPRIGPKSAVFSLRSRSRRRKQKVEIEKAEINRGKLGNVESRKRKAEIGKKRSKPRITRMTRIRRRDDRKIGEAIHRYRHFYFLLSAFCFVRVRGLWVVDG